MCRLGRDFACGCKDGLGLQSSAMLTSLFFSLEKEIQQN
jgi:hypothetical protein